MLSIPPRKRKRRVEDRPSTVTESGSLAPDQYDELFRCGAHPPRKCFRICCESNSMMLMRHIGLIRLTCVGSLALGWVDAPSSKWSGANESVDGSAPIDDQRAAALISCCLPANQR